MKKPSRSSLPALETAICARYAEWEEGTSIPRAAIAHQARVPVANLQMHAAKRAPFTWRVARKLMKSFGLSPAWLMDGTLPQERDFPVFEFSLPSIDPAQKLSVVWAVLGPVLRDADAKARPGNLDVIRRFLHAAEIEGGLRDEAVAAVAAAARREHPELSRAILTPAVSTP